MSEKINVSANYLGRLERGKHSADFDVIENIAKVLEVQPFELFLEPKDSKLPRRVDMQ